MTWKNRFKLFVGLIAVVAVVGVFTVVFNQRQSSVTSASASIQAERYPVGMDYGGTLSERFVDDGERVTEGQVLFTLESATLQADLAKGLVKMDTVAYSVGTDGLVTLTASVAGTVTDITSEPGSFVQAGQVLATINRSGSLYVSADYVLSSRDYSRIEDGAAVEIVLPNQTKVSGHVKSIEVQTADGEAETTLRVESDGLVEGANNNLVSRGTPVKAVLQLRDDGILAGTKDGLSDFFQQIGL